MASISLYPPKIGRSQGFVAIDPLKDRHRRRQQVRGLALGRRQVTRAGSFARRVPCPLADEGTSVAELVRDAREDRAVDAHDDAMITSLELLAHDLRSPLASSRQVVELLLRRHGGDEKVLLVGLDEALACINRMVDDLLGLERLQAVSTVQPVEIDQLVRDCVASCSAPELVEVLTVSTEAEVDPGLMRSSIRNLLENALRHARSEVLLRAGPVTGGVLVVVEDDGPGIPPDLREIVFRPLVRLHHASGDGVGLGLTLVRRAVELHGGRVWVEPSPSGGARFCVWLPRQRP